MTTFGTGFEWFGELVLSLAALVAGRRGGSCSCSWDGRFHVAGAAVDALERGGAG